MNWDSDLIAAEATPAGRGGISVVRVSGAGVHKAVGGLFDREMPAAGRHRFGRLRRAPDADDFIDEVVLICYGAPHSYTGEDMVELSLHGSPVVVAEALDALYAAGARAARPGEFTLRAFLNGKMDLTQAEAVADLIASGSREAAWQARRQLAGGIGRAVNRASDYIVQALAACELELDFVEDDVEVLRTEQKVELIYEARRTLQVMLEGYQHSRRLREGLRVVITGAPNVGKSSLFNALLGEERAIVHRTPGTTRDIIQATCNISGVAVELFDTAGIRESADEIEDEGVRRALQTAETADLKLLVAAADQSLPDDIYHSPDESVLRVVNKIDINRPEEMAGIIGVSAVTGEGVERLKEAIYQAATSGETATGSSISRERHYQAVSRADAALERADKALEAGQSSEVVAEELREALAALDELTGKRRLEGLLDEIFANFCIGK